MAATTTTQRLHGYMRGDLAAMQEQLDIMESAAATLRARISTLAEVADYLQSLEEMVAQAVPVIEAVAADLVAPCLDRMPGGGLAAPQCQFTRDHEGRHYHAHLNSLGIETRTEWHGSYLQITRTEVR